MRFKDVSIRSKVLLVVCVTLFFQVFIALTSLYYLNKTNRNLEEIVDREAEAIKVGARVNTYFRDLIISEKNMIVSKSEAEETIHRNNFDDSRRHLEERLGRLREVTGPDSVDDLDGFEASYREYLTTHQRIRDLIAKNEDVEAMRLSTGMGHDQRTKATAVLTRLVDKLDAALDRRKSENQAAARISITLIIGVLLATLIVALGLGLLVTRAITSGLSTMVATTEAIAGGDIETPIDVTSRDEVGKLASSIDKMQAALRAARDEAQAQDWLKTGLTRLNDVMRGEINVETLATKVISEILEYLDGKIGAFYVMGGPGEEPALSLLGSYAYTGDKNLSNLFKPGEGLVGQAALERKQILVSNVPGDYIKITSGLGEAVPRNICVTPLVFENRVKGVIESGTFGPLTDLQLEYLSLAAPAVAITLETVQGRDQIARSLEESQRLTEELQAQQEELSVANEELEEQTQRLQESEEKLKAQQEELQVINEELEEKNELLERQKKEVELARKDIEEKAKDLALASKYKSEFLANMSHELRTPLNSLLLLAQGLEKNKEGNLTAEQLESARIIHGSGIDLLNLINDILDLSKIEAGRMDLQLGTVRVSDLADGVRASFQHMTEEKGLGLDVVVSEDAPAEIVSDRKRIDQVIRNLVSNAVKFTEKGSVTVRFGRSTSGTDLTRSGLSAGEGLAVAVKDTGIGIAPEQQKIVFEAFQQADGGTARKYGGTGLGLSISRELANLLGGEIQLESEPGNGSTFTLCLPVSVSAGRKVSVGDGSAVSKHTGGVVRDATRQRAAVRIEDDRNCLEKESRVILVIEDDPNFARLLYEKCHEKGFMCLAASTGETGLELAEKHLPAAVVLDIRLPGMDGWAVLAAIKENTRTRHIPVHIVSVEETSTEALRKGAVGHATKPLNQEELEETFRRLEQASAGKPRRVLVVEDDTKIRCETVQLIGNGDVKVDEAENGEQALQALRSGRYDCVVLDLGLPDMSGGELLARLDREGVELPPVIIHTARDLTREEEMDLREHAESIVIKDVRSQERLLDDVSLFLHRVIGNMPEKKKQMILDLHETDVLLKDKKVLIVDDDMRTTFALSRLLAEKGMKTFKAETGERALGLLDQEPNMDLVLMDIMMPLMDGYEAMKRIRAQDKFRKLPIIALTAKAMPEDRAKCITAGANDYLPKPVDEGRLISMMRVWLYK
jgi:CheY-like chemotaxis protein/signal transduction histidine kinase/HAMP domain-containing protein